MAEKVAPPFGYRFCPSDQELIDGFLKPKILGQKLACDVIGDKELYGPNATPWELFDVNDNSWTSSHLKLSEKYLYVFTTLSKIRASETSKQKRIRENTCKKAGCGTWDAKTKKKPIRDCQLNVIGEQRMLLFKIDDTGDQFDLNKAGHFRMHEYSLAGINKGLKSAGGADVVLCKITFDSLKDPVLTHTEMKSGVTDNTESTECLTSGNMFVKDGGLGDTCDYLTVDDLFDNCSQEFDDFGWDSNFTDSFMDMLNSIPEEGVVEDISKLGKRKFEEENVYGSKRICL